MKTVKKLKIFLFFAVWVGCILLGMLCRRALALESGAWIQESTIRENTFQPAAPQADAGDDFIVFSEDLNGTVIYGYANGTDVDRLFYRWREADRVLSGWRKVCANGEVMLDFSRTIALSPGKHILTLEVYDGSHIAFDRMILTVAAAPPESAPSPSIINGEAELIPDTSVGLNPLN